MSNDTKITPVKGKYEMDWKTLGGSLIEAAHEKQNKDARETAINRVSAIMTLIGKERINIENSERRIAKYNDQLNAIENGDFTVSVEGTLKLKDKKLDEPNI